MNEEESNNRHDWPLKNRAGQPQPHYTNNTRYIMQKPARNQPCPCGSGKKYKRCHSAVDPQPKTSSIPTHVLIEAMQALAKKESERKRFATTHGNVKEIISAELGSKRFVASGRNLHYAENWKVFTDFLGSYLAGCLGKEWGDMQVKLPTVQQHPIVQWHTYISLSQQGLQPNDGGLYKTKLGAANAWFRLAYDLYLLEHNSELQKRLIRRLRDPTAFQGARFEAAVAAIMLASGYVLKFANEKGPGKHPEFYATHRETGQVLAVEAKSKHRAGILGFKPDSPLDTTSSFKIDKLLFDAVEKNTQTPLLVFIELNSLILVNGQTSNDIYNKLNESWTKIQALSWDGGFPCVGVVFYNDIAPWFLRESMPDGGYTALAFVFWPTYSKHSFDAKPLLQMIGQGCIQRCNIPLEFPKQH